MQGYFHELCSIVCLFCIILLSAVGSHSPEGDIANLSLLKALLSVISYFILVECPRFFKLPRPNKRVGTKIYVLEIKKTK